MKKKRIISVFQVAAAISLFPLWFTLAPWLLSEPVSGLNAYPDMKDKYPSPDWAEYFTVGHGKPTYFRTSPREQPLRAIVHGGALGACVVFLIISGCHYANLASRQKRSQNNRVHSILTDNASNCSKNE